MISAAFSCCQCQPPPCLLLRLPEAPKARRVLCYLAIIILGGCSSCASWPLLTQHSRQGTLHAVCWAGPAMAELGTAMFIFLQHCLCLCTCDDKLRYVPLM